MHPGYALDVSDGSERMSESRSPSADANANQLDLSEACAKRLPKSWAGCWQHCPLTCQLSNAVLQMPRLSTAGSLPLSHS